ncbi:C-C motif chemokine 20 isoform X1 [Manacus candei]|uniref:C-C motif chemokine 20 isoform X1 n=1 Tax=Manacus candei TaxID=415023 RepID=UPI00222704D2|nr:C-C motif chemokine 20 isoform X1 [Manacus candei]
MGSLLTILALLGVGSNFCLLCAEYLDSFSLLQGSRELPQLRAHLRKCRSQYISAHSNHDCCLSYTKVRLPRWALKGYTEQLASEVCDIPAIIFHTNSGLKACVNPNEGWVKKHLLFLSHKLKRMSA